MNTGEGIGHPEKADGGDKKAKTSKESEQVGNHDLGGVMKRARTMVDRKPNIATRRPNSRGRAFLS